MDAVQTGGARPFEQRRRKRIGCAVSVHLMPESGAVRGAAAYAGCSRDLSTGGVYVVTSGTGAFAPGDILTVSILIPWEMRRAFPFSRISGASRVLRVEPAEAEGKPAIGIALAFCGEAVSTLGSVITPR